MPGSSISALITMRNGWSIRIHICVYNVCCTSLLVFIAAYWSYLLSNLHTAYIQWNT
jgi:hypothetical protein